MPTRKINVASYHLLRLGVFLYAVAVLSNNLLVSFIVGLGGKYD